jgi:hypothetical protein
VLTNYQDVVKLHAALLLALTVLNPAAGKASGEAVDCAPGSTDLQGSPDWCDALAFLNGLLFLQGRRSRVCASRRAAIHMPGAIFEQQQ